MDEVLFIVGWMLIHIQIGTLTKKLYQAYTEQEYFATENFHPYVPRRHSPAGGLLLRLGLIAN